MHSRKNIPRTSAEKTIFSPMKMNFDEDLIGAKRIEGRKGSKIKSEEVVEEDGAATAAEEQLKAIPPGCISLLRALRVLIKIDLRLRRPATTRSYCSCCFLEVRSAGERPYGRQISYADNEKSISRRDVFNAWRIVMCGPRVARYLFGDSSNGV